MLFQLLAVINLHDKDDFFVLGIEGVQLGDNLLVITIARTGTVIAGQPDVARLMAQAVEENDVPVNQ
ncbi:hypothetical protein D3C76_1833160 [compost metagenome]